MRNSNVHAFETSIERLGRILSQQWKINVIFRHGKCETNGNKIYLPVVPNNATPDLLQAMQGHLDHEVGHVKFSDFKLLNKIVKFKKLMSMINAFEDPRIEAKMIEIWPGSKYNLDFAHEWTLHKIKEDAEIDDPNNPGQKILSNKWKELNDYAKITLAANLYVQNGFSEDHWFIKELVEPEILAKITTNRNILLKLKQATNTEDVMNVALEFMKALNEENTEEEDPPQEQEEAGEEGDGSQKDGTSSTSDMRSKFIEDAAQEAMENSTEDSYLVYTTEGDTITPVPAGDRVKYKRFMVEAGGMVSTMKRRLVRSLLSTNKTHWEGDKTRGKINPRALVRVAVSSSKNVFRQLVEQESFDTCVQLMIDHSGSMGCNQLDLAAKSSIILGEVLNQLKIPFSVMGFTTGSTNVATKRFYAADISDQKLYTRWGNHALTMYKDFDEGWIFSNHKLINMSDHSGHNTYDAESLRLAAVRLLARKEKRKILFWLNDGHPQPNDMDDRNAHISYLRKISTAVDSQIELIAIGVQTDAVKNYYKNYVIISNISDLPKACLTQMDNILRSNKNKVERRK